MYSFRVGRISKAERHSHRCAEVKVFNGYFFENEDKPFPHVPAYRGKKQSPNPGEIAPFGAGFCGHMHRLYMPFGIDVTIAMTRNRVDRLFSLPLRSVKRMK